ncbi:heterokaryon incompatibility [Xylariaceae sp. FL0016]|nr:heterokaryon incompatibility [Xylariaceae sp. FL0016]
MKKRISCSECETLDRALRDLEACLPRGGMRRYAGPVDFILGDMQDVESRSLDGCSSCQSIISCFHGLELEVELIRDCEVTAHLSQYQPRVTLSLGNPGDGASNNRAGARRRRTDKLITVNLMSMKSHTLYEARARMVDTNALNLDLVRRWMRRCEHHHEGTCGGLGNHELYRLPGVTPNFIDVREMRITTPDDQTPKYAALSYVWGTLKFPVATLENIAMLRIPGALSREKFALPKTIEDAVWLCNSLDIRYLWVDSLCIVQNDLESKSLQINAMATIYGKAYFTIAALASEAADSGIRRISQRPTDEVSYIHLPSASLLVVPIDEGDRRSSYDLDVMNGNKWDTRAWTLQERAFSKRILGVGKVTTWVCRGAHWTEEIEYPSELVDDLACADNVPNAVSATFWPSLRDYGRVAQHYAPRDLTMSSDTTNAFQGVMTVMSQWFPAGLLFGIPEYTFDAALLWEYRGEGALPRSGQGWESGEPQFPSWSWISYQGRGLYTRRWTEDHEYPKPPTLIEPLAKWEKCELSKSGKWKSVDNTYHVVRKHFQNSATPIPEGWVKHQPEEGPIDPLKEMDGDYDGPYYQHPAHSHVRPHPKFSFPIPPFQRYRDTWPEYYAPYIRFTGPTTKVTLTCLGEPSDRHQIEKVLATRGATPEMEIIMGDGTWGGRMRLNLNKGESLPGQEQCQLIAISHARTTVEQCRWASSMYSDIRAREELEGVKVYECVNVLWIGWRDDGKAYRKGLGRVWKDVWERCEGDAEELTCLLI